MVKGWNRNIIVAKVVIALFVCHSSTVFSQSQMGSIWFTKYDTLSRKSWVLLDGCGALGSQVLDNRFADQMLLGGKLDKGHLRSLADRMNEQNGAGMDVCAGLSFWNFSDTIFKKPNLGFMVQIGARYQGSLTFTRDFFEVGFLGNADYAGRTAELGPLNGNLQAWQKFGFGIFNKKTKSYVSLSLIEGQLMQNISLRKGDFFTSATGDSLSLQYNGEYIRSDTARKGLMNGSGVGFCLDAGYNYVVPDGKSWFRFELQDMGLIFWNRATERYQLNGQNSFTGLVIDDINNLSSDSIDVPDFRDSLRYDYSKKRIAMAVQGRISLSFTHRMTSRSYLHFATMILPNRAALPQIRASYAFAVRPSLLTSLVLSYGGYAAAGAGIDIQWMPKGNWYLRAQSGLLTGWLLPKSRGVDLGFTLGKNF